MIFWDNNTTLRGRRHQLKRNGTRLESSTGTPEANVNFFRLTLSGWKTWKSVTTIRLSTGTRTPRSKLQMFDVRMFFMLSIFLHAPLSDHVFLTSRENTQSHWERLLSHSGHSSWSLPYGHFLPGFSVGIPRGALDAPDLWACECAWYAWTFHSAGVPGIELRHDFHLHSPLENRLCCLRAYLKRASQAER
jgi:hypothetical protein